MSERVSPEAFSGDKERGRSRLDHELRRWSEALVQLLPRWRGVDDELEYSAGHLQRWPLGRAPARSSRPTGIDRDSGEPVSGRLDRDQRAIHHDQP